MSDPDRAYRIATMCLILPCSRPDLEAASRLADLALALSTNHSGRTGFGDPWTNSGAIWPGFAATKALAEYRQGRFASALQWAQQASSHPYVWAPLEVEAHAVQAMAQNQLKQADSAAHELAKAEEIADTRLPKLESGQLGDSPFSWIIAHALLREAKELVEGKGIVQFRQAASESPKSDSDKSRAAVQSRAASEAQSPSSQP